MHALLDFGQILSQIGVKEPQVRAGEAFSQFAEAHRDMEKFAISTMKTLRPVRYPDLEIAN